MFGISAFLFFVLIVLSLAAIQSSTSTSPDAAPDNFFAVFHAASILHFRRRLEFLKSPVVLWELFDIHISDLRISSLGLNRIKLLLTRLNKVKRKRAELGGSAVVMIFNVGLSGANITDVDTLQTFGSRTKDRSQIVVDHLNMLLNSCPRVGLVELLLHVLRRESLVISSVVTDRTRRGSEIPDPDLPCAIANPARVPTYPSLYV